MLLHVGAVCVCAHAPVCPLCVCPPVCGLSQEYTFVHTYASLAVWGWTVWGQAQLPLPRLPPLILRAGLTMAPARPCH